jgi:hypothetical protein
VEAEIGWNRAVEGGVKGALGWEYKGKHANLGNAYGQLLLYQGALENRFALAVQMAIYLASSTPMR